jgi:O-antigen/teichoic acid export membrane protein
LTVKQKAITGMFWSFVDSLANQGIQFITGIVLARILSPREFGLIGMLSIFIAISQTFIDSGFSNALIRKQDCSQDDYSTVFYFNLAVSVLFYLILFVSANAISLFLHEEQLKQLIKILGLSLVISSLSIIHRTILNKKIDFKLQARVSVISSVCSGIVAIIMASSGYGVWSLVVLTLTKFALNSVLLWIWVAWKPILVFSKKSFTQLFSFGSKLLASSLIDTIYRNINNLMIGKYFSADQLGYYATADQYQALPSQNLQSIIGRVSYPILSSIQEDQLKLKFAFIRLVRSTMFISFLLMLGLAVIAKPLILTLIGIKWIIAAEYLQMLCFVGIFYPLHALNLNMLQVEGRSDLFLKLEILKKMLAIPVIIIGILFGIKIMIAGMIINNIIAYYINSYWSGKHIDYSFLDQIKDITPSFIMALVVNGIIYFMGHIIHVEPWLLLIIQISMGLFITVIICELLNFSDYLYMRNIIFDFFGLKFDKWRH